MEQYGVMNFFDCQGWRCLLVDGKPIYPLLVKYYTNLAFNHINHSVRSFVNGKDITLDESTLAKILNIPYNGWGIESLIKWSHSPLPPWIRLKLWCLMILFHFLTSHLLINSHLSLELFINCVFIISFQETFDIIE